METIFCWPVDPTQTPLASERIEEEEGDKALAGMFHGPFYSWIDTTDEASANESVVNSVRLVMKVVQMEGPFDGIYSFSNGEIGWDVRTDVRVLLSFPLFRCVLTSREK